MKVVLHDWEHGADDPFDGLCIDDPERLCEVLEELQRRDPIVLQIEGENGFSLAIGIGGPVGFIQHSSNDGRPPFLIAVDKDAKQIADDIEHVFFCGGQDTPFRRSQCVPYEVLKSVASHFLEFGSRSDDVDWVGV
jgi:hypothetical protein